MHGMPPFPPITLPILPIYTFFSRLLLLPEMGIAFGFPPPFRLQKERKIKRIERDGGTVTNDDIMQNLAIYLEPAAAY